MRRSKAKAERANKMSRISSLEARTALANTFPQTGKVRAKQCAAVLGIAVSTFWLYVKEGRIKQPMKFGARVSVWDAEYIIELGKNGIPEKPDQEAA